MARVYDFAAERARRVLKPLLVEQPCTRCFGDGEVVNADPDKAPMLCPKCGGTGRTEPRGSVRDVDSRPPRA